MRTWPQWLRRATQRFDSGTRLGALTLRRAARERGRFHSFLVGALKLCLADEHARRHTLKRGGHVQFISIDELEAEELHHLRADREAAPDEILDARWAGVLLERALEKLRLEFDVEEKP